MSELGDIVEVIISNETVAVERAAFGRLAIIGEFPSSVFPQKYREIADPKDAATLFPNAYDAMYKAAVAAHSDDNFKPDLIFIRRDPGTSEIHAYTLDRGAEPSDGLITLKVDGVKIVDIEYAELDTKEDVADAIQVGVNEITSHPYRVSVEEAAGVYTVLLNCQYGANEYDVEFEIVGDVTLTEDAASSVAAVPSAETIPTLLNTVRDLGANFFGVANVSDRDADVLALAEYVAGEPYLAAVRLHDATGAGATDPSASGTAAHQLFAAGYGNTLAYLHSHRWLFPDVRNFAPTIAIDPDTQSSTFALRSPQGLPDPYYANGKTQAMSALDALNVNYFKRRGGILIAWEGKAVDGGYADIKFSEMWLTARLQERVFGRLQGVVQGGSKLGYDDDGGTVLEGEARDMIADAIAAQHVTANIDPTFATPSRVDIPSQTVMTRQFPPIVVEAYWAGAIHQARFRFVMLF